MKFRIGDCGNGQETSKHIIEDLDYVEVLEMMIRHANLYCEPVDKEAENCVEQINDFCRENNRLRMWEGKE